MSHRRSQIGLLLIVAAYSHSQSRPSSPPSGSSLPDPPKPQVTSASRPNPDEKGIYHIGDGVSAPIMIYSMEPEFSEQARKRKVSGNIKVEFVVDVEGIPQDIHILKADGYPNTNKKDVDAIHSLEPKALEAVKSYRFKPATLNGKPVPCRMSVQVDFQVF